MHLVVSDEMRQQEKSKMAAVAMFFDRSDFILVLAQLDIKGSVLTKI